MMKAQSEEIDVETLIRYIRIFSDLSGQIKYATQKRVMVEVALIKLCRPQMETSYSDIISRLKMIEEQLEKGVVPKETKVVIKEEKLIVEEKKEDIVLEKAVSEDLKEVAKNWSKILNTISPLTKAVLVAAKPSIGNNNDLLLVFTEAMDKEFISQESHINELKGAIAKVIHKDVEIQTKLLNEGKEAINDIPDLTKIIKNIPIEYED